MSIKKFFPFFSLLLLLSLGGCAEKISLPEFNAQYYPDCYDPITKLCNGQFNEKNVLAYRPLFGEQSKNWSKERIAAELTNHCYEKQLTVIKEAYQEKKMEKEELVARMLEIKNGIANLNLLQEKTGTSFSSDNADSEKFLREEEARLAKTKQKKPVVKKVKTDSGSSTLKRASKKERQLLEQQLKEMDELSTSQEKKEN